MTSAQYDDPDRKRGILAPVDRKHLLGLKEYEYRQNAHHRRREIRKRVRNAILDFRLLVEELPADERRAIFSWQADREFGYQFGVRDALAFLYLSQREQGLAFQGVLKQGIGSAWRTLEGENIQVKVDLDLDIQIHEPDYHDIGALLDKVDAEGTDALTDDELVAVVRYADGEGLLDDALDEARAAREAERERSVEFAEQVHGDKNESDDVDESGQ